MLSHQQAKLLAHTLTRRHPPGSGARMGIAVAGAQVDLNPHQVDAALFAFASPLSKGALLADEVGLGKTIEAGLVISQRWAEHRRRILIISPSNLRKQWHQELAEKFFIPAHILEAKSYNSEINEGRFQPFERKDSVVICSYQFARNKAADVQRISWDLVVIDEAHRLRNVYKPTNVIANTLRRALEGRHKLLLTATPLQNSLLELFGLVSIIDEHSFGDLKSFREQFSSLSQEQTFEVLRQRLKPICHRTLRRQVSAYVPYTRRHPLLERFTPDQAEQDLYEAVTEYLRRDNLQALPVSQRALITLVLRKLLASSTFAIAGALTTMADRLQAKLDKQVRTPDLVEELDEDYEALDETAEEWSDDHGEEALSEEDRNAINKEIADLRRFATLANDIDQNAKGRALLTALTEAFKRAKELGAAEKAIIFTESKRTQGYLLCLLADSPFGDGIVLFNGSNTDPSSRKIYNEWLARNKGTDRVTGSRTADMRSALVDEFRDRGRILIATEAGAEGINLQFCSLVVNYDLPWNPQRIEQRIGRCHRYGQKHDVVVVNFLNEKNAADERVYELLDQKFKLFDGVFGSSDEVLGSIESGIDFEKRIAGIYQECRDPSAIEAAFSQLRSELNTEISDAMAQTRQKLLENFDDEVREKLKTRDTEARTQLRQFEADLMKLARHELNEVTRFESENAFELEEVPTWAAGLGIDPGLYELPRQSGDAHLFRISHPLGEAILKRAKQRTFEPVELVFNLTDHPGKISSLEPYKGQSGWFKAQRLSITALDQGEDHVLLSGIDADGSPMGPELLARMVTVGANAGEAVTVPQAVLEALESDLSEQSLAIRKAVSERNARYFEEEAAKLDGWADDLKVGLEREIKDIDRRIKEARRAATLALSLEEKLAGQKAVKALEAERSTKRRSLFEAQDRIDAQRAELIEEIEGKLGQEVETEELFVARWSVA